MALRKRTVTGTLVDAAGVPVATSKIEFNLTSPLGTTVGYVIVDRAFTVTTDVLGTFSIDLWCDEDSLNPIDYTVTFPVVDNATLPDRGHLAKFSLVYSADPIDIGTLVGIYVAAPATAVLNTQMNLWASLSSINLFQDVIITDPQVGDAFIWNGTNWVNSAVGGGGSTTLAGLTDVTITSVADNDFLQRKSGDWVNRTVAQVKIDLGINNVNNTSDADKPVSTATANALTGKQATLSGLALTPVTPQTTDKVLIQDLSDSDNLKTTTIADILALGGGSMTVGAAVGGATAGSILYIDAAGNLAQNNAKLFFDATLGIAKFVDKNYVPFSGSLNADTFFSVGSNDNIQNNAGVITTSNHLMASSFDFKVDATGASKYYVGQHVQLRVTGSYTGTPAMYGQWVQLNNRGNVVATPNMYGQAVSVSIEGHANDALGSEISIFKGSAINALKVTGLRVTSANGYTNADTITGIESIARTVSGGATITTARSIQARMWVVPGHVVSNARGLSLDTWINTGSIVNSYGIYADTSIDVGTTSRYFIYSLSTSDSLFSGKVIVPNVAYGAGWNGDFSVPTKSAVYNAIIGLSTGGMSIGGAISGSTDGSVLFVTAGTLGQNNANFYYDLTTKTLKLGDSSYLGNTAGASAGWQNTQAFLKIGFDTAYVNNTQPVYASQMDMKRSQTGGSGQQTTGLRPRAWIQDTGSSGGGIATAVEAFVDNTGSTVSTSLQAIEGITQVAANGLWAVGGWFQMNAAANLSFAGWGVRSLVTQSAGTTGTAVVYETILSTTGSGAITNGYGIRMAGWGGSGIVNSYGLYMDTSIDRGTSLKYAIYSLSTSPSVLSGALSVPDEAYGSAWNGKGEVPTKNAVYDYSVGALPVSSQIPAVIAKPMRLSFFDLAVGDNDLYTVPAGHKLIITSVAQSNNNAGSVTNYHSRKISGTYYRLTTTGATPTGNNGTSSVYLVLNAGESYSVNVGATGLNIYIRGFLIPDSTNLFNVRTILVQNPTNTVATYYTVPAGKKAIVLNNGALYTSNDSGGARTYLIHHVPSGGSASSSNQLLKQTTTNTNNTAFALLSISAVLDEGETIQIAADSTVTGHQLWFTVAEIDA